MKTRILIVEDEPDVGGFLKMVLQNAEYEVVVEESAHAAEQKIEHFKPDLILLDWMMPVLDGLQYLKLLRSRRSHRNTPIIVVTARDAAMDKVKGLESGADDYITKPFDIEELKARIEALLRRSSTEQSREKTDDFSIGNLVLMPQKMRVCFNGKTIPLSSREFRLLHLLLSHPDRIYSRDQILDEVWGHGIYVGDRVVDVFIHRIRTELESYTQRHFIETVRGLGYRGILPAGAI